MEARGEESTQKAAAVGEKRKKKVAVAIDESEASFYALKFALDYLFDCTGAAAAGDDEEHGVVVLLHVKQPFQHYVIPGPVPPAVYVPSSSVIESVRKVQEQNSAILLSRAMGICKDKPVKAETMVMEGDPKDMICQAVEQIHPDLLVMGSRGLGLFKRTFLGSVSDYCAHNANCAVLIVKPHK